MDDALQRAAGRRDPVRASDDQQVREHGLALHRLRGPGLLGMNIMGGGIWGLGFAIVDARRKKLLKRLVATPMSRAQYLASFMFSRLSLLVIEVGVLLGFGVLVFGVPVRGSLAQLVADLPGVVAGVRCAGTSDRLARADDRRRLGADEPGDAADVGVLRRVLLVVQLPRAVQPFIQALPLTAVNDALRANMLRGADWHR